MVLRKQKVISILFYFFASITLVAQTNSYIIYLSDKKGTLGTFDNPTTYLSTRAIEKKAVQNIVLDSTDLPVSKKYIDLLKNEGAEIVYTSKWLNAVCVKATPIIYASISALPCVMNSVPMLKVSGAPNTHTINGSANINYSSNYSDFLGITYMHDAGIKGSGVLIAVTDSGFPGVDTLTAFKHLWTNNQLIYYYDVADNESNIFNDDNHGTYMLSVLAGEASNYKGIVPDANYILLRTEVAATESKLEEYNWAMNEMMKDSGYLYDSMIKDIYFLGVVLAKKYKYLRISYTIFMWGIIAAVIAFAIAAMYGGVSGGGTTAPLIDY